jgi:hypothetical protein
MESKPLTTGRTPPERQGRQYASSEEVAAAAEALTETDHAKLMMIAKFFCAKRRLPPEVIEPQDLLHQAVLKTLSRDKKWYKEIPLVKHLDRAMENISGHMVRERLKGANKVVPFPDGLTPPEEEPGRSDRTPQLAADESIIVREDINAALAEIFADDEIALTVFLKRVDGHQASEIQSQLCLSATQYEAISKRILRKTTKYLNS